MFAAGLRVVLSVVLSPRRLLIAALVTTFFYAALVATKARLSPGPAVRAGKPVAAASTRSSGHRPPAPGGARTE